MVTLYTIYLILLDSYEASELLRCDVRNVCVCVLLDVTMFNQTCTSNWIWTMMMTVADTYRTNAASPRWSNLTPYTQSYTQTYVDRRNKHLWWQSLMICVTVFGPSVAPRRPRRSHQVNIICVRAYLLEREHIDRTCAARSTLLYI